MNVQIRFHSHPLAPAEVCEAESLAEWLVERFPEPPDGLMVFQDQTPLLTPAAILGARGLVRVVLQPGWAQVGAYVIQALIAVAVSYVIGALLAKDPAQQRRDASTRSDNNSLGERSNKVRILERVEDIYGQVLSVPSLMMPTYRKYVNHRQVEVGYYCVGRGYFDITQLQDGDTPLGELTGVSAAVYDPFSSPNAGTPAQQIGPAISDRVLQVKRSTQVDGVTLQALNQIQIEGLKTYGMEGATLTQIQGRWGLSNARPNLESVLEVGDSVRISAPARQISLGVGSAIFDKPAGTVRSVLLQGVAVGDVFWLDLSVDTGASGDIREFYAAEVISSGKIRVTDPSGLPDSGTIQSVGVLVMDAAFVTTRNVISVSSRTATFSGAAFPTQERPAELTILSRAPDAWTPWYTANDPTASQAWVNVAASGGIYKDDGGGKVRSTVSYELQVESPVGGPVYTITSSLYGATQDERAETLQFSLPVRGSFRARMRRVTPFDWTFEGVVIDEIKWVDLYSVTQIAQPHFGDKTTIHTSTPATVRATASRQRQLNCRAFRRLPAFNGTSWSGATDAEGRIAWGTLQPTARAADVMAAIVQDPKIGARPLTDLDWAQVWRTQMEIEAWAPECGEFNYTFDSTDSSTEDMLGAVANAVFSTAYRQSGRVRLFFERAQSQPVGLFSHRNKRPESETVTRMFARNSDYDGVEIEYRDRDSTQAETIRLPLGSVALRYKQVRLAGVTHFKAAWYRACREMAKLDHQRIGIDTEVTGDGRLMTPGALALIVDNTRFKSYDGEVLAQDGLTLTLSQPVELGVNPTVALKRRNGSVESIPVTAGADRSKIVLARLPLEQIVTEVTGDGGLRTEFSVASNDRRDAQRYLIQEVSRSEGEYVSLTAINYTDAYYAGDTEPVPPRESVINAT